jgi:ATP-dependent Clp protease proteolytic subunit ClpP (EC 3.4.21.92)
MPLVPMVVKRTHEGERSMDLYSRLLDERIVLLTEPIDSIIAGIVVAQLLYLQSEDATKDITMYINSPGGSITAMWSIIDTMNLVRPDVSTVCVGMAASAASVILAAGAKGKRYILPHAEVMIHQPLGGAQGQASDIEITAKHILKTKDILQKYMAGLTGQPVKKIEKDMDRDFFMDAQEAVNYGIVDKIIGQSKIKK